MTYEGKQTWVAFPQIRIVDTGPPSRPTVISNGATLGYIMAINDQMFVEFPLHPEIDDTKDIVVGVSWAPAGNEVAKTVTWQLNSLAQQDGGIITGAGTPHQAVDVAVPAVLGTYVRTGILIPAAEIVAGTDEFHCRISRIASSADPVADPGIHHIAVIQQLLP